MRSGAGSFGSRGPAFRGSTGFRSGGPVVFGSGGGFGSRGVISFRSGGVGFGASVGFGNHRRGGLFLHQRPFHHPRGFAVYPNRYSYSSVYPYVVYPAYPLSYYDAYDYTGIPVQAVTSYAYGYASGEDNYPVEPGLAEQMRQQGVGVYAQPRTAAPQPAPAPQATQPPDRGMPPTVLIYRDGRRTEVRNYAIVGQTVWTFTERVANKIPLDQLDLNATRKANEERGQEFVVPPQ